MDWERSYYTMTDPNISYIWGFLKVCHERGWLYQGHRSMPWCPRCGTSLSQHELIDSYRELTPPVAVRPPAARRPRRRVPGGLDDDALDAAGERRRGGAARAEYARRSRPGRSDVALRLPQGRREAALAGEPRSWARVKGAELVGLHYTRAVRRAGRPAGRRAPRRRLGRRAMDEGTGIVHIAPGCGAEDFELGKREGLAVIPVDEAGAFFDGYGWLHGRT